MMHINSECGACVTDFTRFLEIGFKRLIFLPFQSVARTILNIIFALLRCSEAFPHPAATTGTRMVTASPGWLSASSITP